MTSSPMKRESILDGRADQVKAIAANTAEVDDMATLEDFLLRKASPKSLWGVAPTGPVHIGYLPHIAKQLDLIELGFENTLIVADLHAYLDRKKAEWETLEAKSVYYRLCLQALGLDLRQTNLVYGHDLHIRPDYIEGLLRLSVEADLMDVWKATIGTTQMIGFPRLSEMFYTLMQVYDVEFLDISIALCGMDESPIYRYGRKLLQEYSGHRFVGLYTEMCTGVLGREMHASDQANLIPVHDPTELLRLKIARSYLPEDVLDQDNLFIWTLKNVLFGIAEEQLILGSRRFSNWSAFRTYCQTEDVDPGGLRKAVADFWVEFLEPVRKAFLGNLDVIQQAQGITYDVYP